MGSLQEMRWKFPDEGLGMSSWCLSVASGKSLKGIKIHLPRKYKSSP